MWVTFYLDNRNDSAVLNKYQVEDEAAVELPEHITTGELLNLIMSEASVSPEELLKRDCVKVSIPLCMFNKLVFASLESTCVLSQSSSDELPAMLRTIICQQRQISQQRAAIETLATTLTQRINHSSPYRIIRPDTFKDASDNPEVWIDFYEQAAKNNGWLSDEDSEWPAETADSREREPERPRSGRGPELEWYDQPLRATAHVARQARLAGGVCRAGDRSQAAA
ncbi:hypothetical protein HPB50_007629 [Hyalomma asiaticum]|uniref:Uncharacterized protein n=1 Tax=Hyalomma asiaticum TaxID=266040 RepID=A0ACB7S3G3_HYAAI|nr:hypothetical protein HPB50_007629 [Hyalomma asiaticum]